MALRKTLYDVLGVARDASDGAFALDIESISGSRMVQAVGDGHRLACERR